MAAHDAFERDLPRALRGYEPEAVQKLLSELAASYEALLHERDAERERTAMLELELRALAERAGALAVELEQFHAREGLIRDTLVTAQKTASEIREGAKRSASATLRKARGQAERIVETAERRRTRLEAEIQGLQRLADSDRAEMAGLLKSLLEQLTPAPAPESRPAEDDSERALQPDDGRFEPGDRVRLTEPTLGMVEDQSGERGSREFWEVSPSEVGRVVDHDAADLVEVIFEHDLDDSNGRRLTRLVVEAARLAAAEPEPADSSLAS